MQSYTVKECGWVPMLFHEGGWTGVDYLCIYARLHQTGRRGPGIQMGYSSLACHEGLVYSDQEESQTWVDYSWVPEWE